MSRNYPIQLPKRSRIATCKKGAFSARTVIPRVARDFLFGASPVLRRSRTPNSDLPLDYMLRVIRNPTASAKRRDDMAKAAAPYPALKVRAGTATGAAERASAGHACGPV